MAGFGVIFNIWVLNRFLFLRFTPPFKLCVYVCVCVSVQCVSADAHTVQKRMSYSLELEFRGGCEQPDWMLGE